MTPSLPTLLSSDLEARGVEAGLDAAQRRQLRRAFEFGQYVALHLSDAMFGRNRTAEFDDVRIDQPADRRDMFGEPRRAIATGGRLDVVMEVADGQLAQGQRAYPGDGQFKRGRSLRAGQSLRTTEGVSTCEQRV